MSNPTYNVIIEGITHGRNPDEVKKNLTPMFKSNPDRIDTLLSGKKMIVKRGADRATALKYKGLFDKAGMACRVEPTDKARVAPPGKKPAPQQGLTLEMESAPKEEERKPAVEKKAFACPKCGTEQPKSPECVKCGIIFSKVMQDADQQAADEPGGPLHMPGSDLPPGMASRIGILSDEEVVEPINFYEELPVSLYYPFRGSGLFMLIGGTIFFSILDYVSHFIGLLFIISLFAYGYFCAYLIKIINSSADGNKEPPDWPDFSDLFSDIIVPIFKFFITFVVCYIPLGGYVYYRLKYAPYNADETLFLDPTIWILFVGGTFYYPMALLGFAMTGRIMALTPVLVLPAILKAPVAYLTCVTAFFIILGLRNFFQFTLNLPVPVVGTVLQQLVMIYFGMVSMRILGNLYNANAEEWNWFGDF